MIIETGKTLNLVESLELKIFHFINQEMSCYWLLNNLIYTKNGFTKYNYKR